MDYSTLASVRKTEDGACPTISLPVAGHTGNSLRNLVNLFYTRAKLINKALGTDYSVDCSFVNEIAGYDRLNTAEEFLDAVNDYEEDNGHAFSGISFTQDRITFSTFPETEDPDRIKSYTVLMSAMANQALKQKRIQAKTVNDENEKYSLRIWLLRLGLNGPEHKAVRKILMQNLSGDSAFRTEEEKRRWQGKHTEKRDAAKAKDES